MKNMKKKIKVGISGINPLCGNRGVGALAISTIHILKRIEETNDIIIEPVIISPDHYGLYQISICDEKVSVKSIYETNIFNIQGIIRVLSHPKNILSFLEYFKFDYMLCMGAGDSFSDIYGLQRFNSINSQHKIARFFLKQYVLLPQTIGPFKDKYAKKKANKSIMKAKLTFARDYQSYKYIRENIQSKNIFEAIDVAFFMPFEKKIFSNEYIHVGINISSLLWHGGYTQNNQFGLKSDYQELIYSIIDNFLSIGNVLIHIVPHAVSLNSDIENDYEVSLNLENKYSNRRIVLAPFFLDPIMAKNYISGLDFFIGSRMHSTIAAFSSGVPVFPMAYSRKFNGLFKNTLDYPYMGDLINEDLNDILQKLKNAFSIKEILAEIIQNRLNEIVRNREKLLFEKLECLFCDN